MQQNWRLIDYYGTSVQADGPLIPWYNAASIDQATLPAGVQLGECFWVKGSTRSGAGNAYMWVKATVGLTVGQLVAWAAPGTDTALTNSTTSVLLLTTGNLTVNAEVDNFVWVDGSVTKELRRIKSNTASSITVAQTDPYVASNPKDADVFTTAPSNTNPVSIIRPWNVRVCTAALQPVGVALGTVTSGNYTPVQIAGLALVSAIGNGTALVMGVPAIPANSGQILGGGGTANLYGSGSAIVPQYAYAGAGQVIPCLVNFTGA